MDADEAPYNSLQLEHAYGYRGHDRRNNLLYTAEGHIVYMVAAIGVVYTKTAMRSTYSMHTDDIISIAMHPDKRIVATGQVGKVPLIQVCRFAHPLAPSSDPIYPPRTFPRPVWGAADKGWGGEKRLQKAWGAFSNKLRRDQTRADTDLSHAYRAAPAVTNSCAGML